MRNLNGFPRVLGRALVGILVWLLAFAAVAEPHVPESGAPITGSPDRAQSANSSSGEIRLSQSSYEAWDGDWSNPHFLFGGETTSVPPRLRPARSYLSGEDTGAESGTSTDVVVAYVRCSVSAHRPHRGEGPSRTDVTKAKASGECRLTPTGQGPVPPEPTVLWLLSLILRDASEVVGSTLYFRTGHNPDWYQNPRNGFPGTQVFRYGYGCVNGGHTNSVSAHIIPPWPYTYVGPVSLDDDREYGYVSGC